MTRFSANLGFLWSGRPLVDAIHAAHDAGFDAVECHWPYDHDPAEVKAALDATGLAMLGLNTLRGDVDSGDNGLTALPGRRDEARMAIDGLVQEIAAAHVRQRTQRDGDGEEGDDLGAYKEEFAWKQPSLD